MPRTKKKRDYYVSEAEMEELRALSADEKLGRLKYLDDEVVKTKQAMKDQRESGREYIKELEARRFILMGAVDSAPIQN